MATEVELKLYCAPDDLARVIAHPLIAAGVESGPAKRLENTYFDTPALRLHHERTALRVRSTPNARLQTVKCAAKSVAGLSSRPEWETPFGGSFDFSGVDVPEVRGLLEGLQADLVPIFTTNFERRTWRIDIAKKVSLWVMVDCGEVSSGDRTLTISEVELELAQGKPEDLLDFAAALTTDLPLVPQDISKAERGYQLFLQHAPRAQRAGPSPLTIKHSAADAYRQLAEQGMQLWQANLLGALTSPDEEFVHQFRVALRRLNSLHKVFKPALAGRFQRDWTKRLKALSQITGDVRDLDVMRRVIIEPMLRDEDAQRAAHAEAALAVLERSRQAAQSGVEQLRYGGPVLLFARDLHDLDTTDFPKSLPRFAEKQLATLHRAAVKRLTKTLKAPTPERAHRFRIALKHLRYSCEFFAPLFDAEEMSDYAKTIASLQDAFGFINDFHVALSRLRNWVDEGAIVEETRKAIAQWHAPQAQNTLEEALHLAETVMGRCQPWCTECERRGLSHVRRRLRSEITLHFD